MSQDTKTFVNSKSYWKLDGGFTLHLTPDARIFPERLPRLLIYNEEQRTLSAPNGSCGRTIGGLTGKVGGDVFSIGCRIVAKVCDNDGNLVWVNDNHR